MAEKKPKKPKPVVKRRIKKPRKPPSLAVTAAEYPPTHSLRQQALADYVTDPESRDAKLHFMRPEREYMRRVSLEIFMQWKHDDHWDTKREAYWAEAQRQLLEKTRDHTVQTLADSMSVALELKGYVLEWADPIRDAETGEVLRYPDVDDQGLVHRFAGKPMLAVRPKNLESAIAAYLALDETVRDRRDEVLRLTGQGDSASRAAEDPVAATLRFSPEEIRSMAVALTRSRQPELVGSTLDIEPGGGSTYEEDD